MKTTPVVFQLDAFETERWFAPQDDSAHPTVQRDVYRQAIRDVATRLAKAARAASFKIKASNGNLCMTAAVPQKPAPLRELTDDEAAAIRAYAKYHGRYWKRDLAIDWERACADLYPAELQSTLQSIRNSHGPSWLKRYRLES